MKSAYDYLGTILGVDSMCLERMDQIMTKKIGRAGILEKVAADNERVIDTTLRSLHAETRSTIHIFSVLRKTIFHHERELLEFLRTTEGADDFEKTAELARRVVHASKGFFLKKEHARSILERRPPQNVMKYLGVATVGEMLEKHDVTEVFAALRFIESADWMHQTFEEVYSTFTPDDFEERAVEIRVLGPIWRSVANGFVAKKHHNVSHLKEFGVIFLNPIQENIPGKFLRDFALLFHYFHEISFYAKLFKKYAKEDDFAAHLKMLLRGDVPEVYKAEDGEWLIVQRYLSKENPNDPRLSLPRVNPESLHWLRGERDLTSFDHNLGLSLWQNLDWVGGIFQNGEEDVVSFDLEDNAMSLVTFMEGKEQFFNYHQREAMWTRIFMEYAGGELAAERLLVDNFVQGIIRF